MNKDQVNPFVENAGQPSGGAPSGASSQPTGTAAQPTASLNNQPGDFPPSLTPVNPYAPTGAPFAPGSNTPPPSYATPGGASSSPAVPNTSGGAYTSFSTSASPVYAADPQDRPKSFNKKLLIILLVALVLLAAAVIIVALVLRNDRNSSSNSSGTSTATSQTLFRHYANYMISGSDSADTLPESYQASEDYYALSFFNQKTAAADKGKLSTATELLDNFYNRIDSEKIPADSDLGIALENYRDYFTGFSSIITAGFASTDELGDLYLQNGRAVALSQYSQSYATLNIPRSDLKDENSALQENYASSIFDLYDFYSQNGCIVDNAVSAVCVAPETYTDNIEKARSAILSFYSEMASTLVSGCWGMTDYLSSDLVASNYRIGELA